jgi:hypothetical protein
MAARPLTITVVNQPGLALELGNIVTTHGDPIVIQSGSNPLANQAQAVLYTQNSGTIGPQGTFSYTFQDGSGRAFNFNFNHPYGTGSTYVNVSSPNGYTSSMPINNLPHHTASCTINLQQLAG